MKKLIQLVLIILIISSCTIKCVKSDQTKIFKIIDNQLKKIAIIEIFQYFNLCEEKNDQKVCEIESRIVSRGTGMVINKDKKYILTNKHVTEKGEEFRIHINQKVYRGILVDENKYHDLAILKIDHNDVDIEEIKFQPNSKIGEFVIAIGHPKGLFYTTTHGIISSKRIYYETFLTKDKNNKLKKILVEKKLIQTDAAINQGNSGGPLFNLNGEVVGIVSNIRSGLKNEVIQIGLNFAISSEIILNEYGNYIGD